MHSPAGALAWEFWRRHRLGLAAVAALVVGFAAYCAAAPVSRTFGFVSSVWFGIGLCYVIGVFAYGFEGGLESPASGFPARLFVLPVHTWVLVGWPMLQGTAAAVLLWLGWDSFVLRPCGVETPAWWAVMLAAVVATGQAILWLPFGLPWLRILVGAVGLTALIRAPALLDFAPSFGVSEGWVADPDHRNTVLSVFAAALIPVAFLVAVVGVGRARRGDNPDWSRLGRFLRRGGESGTDRSPFASVMRAQVWYEWRLRGRGFVVTVALVVAVLVTVGLLLEHRSNRADLGLMFLMVPPLIAAFWGTQMGSTGESVRSTALTTFAATRALDNPAMVSAKVRAATWTTVVTFGVVLVAVAAWFAVTDGYEKMSLLWEALAERHGSARASGYFILFPVGLFLLTWRALVANLWVGLAGRTWMVPAHTILMTLIVLQGLAEWALWNADTVRREQLLDVLPWVAGVAIALKFVLAGWALRALNRRGQLSAAALVRLLGTWLLVAGSLFGFLVWLVPSSSVPVYGLALGVVLFVPLARLAAAPLALAWNRHH
ncbi:MAG TPA: hypothetical protein VKE74_21175 [Gemmataceae bacterium]|nr:hypothetical protein [Gemmataceae bacterium]